MATLNDRCFCCFTAVMLVLLGRAARRCLHTKLYKFRCNSFPNNAGMKNLTDLNLGDVVSINHIPDSIHNCFFLCWRGRHIGNWSNDLEANKVSGVIRTRVISYRDISRLHIFEVSCCSNRGETGAQIEQNRKNRQPHRIPKPKNC